MTCIQLTNGDFWLHSPSRFEQATYDKIQAKGNVKYLVSPNLMHNLFIMDWKQKNVTSQVLASAQAKKVNPDIKLNETPEKELNQLFNNEITCLPINGLPFLQEYAFVHHASKTLIITDLAFNFGKDSKGLTKLMLTLYGAYGKFGPTITVRSLIKDKKAFSESLSKIALENFDRIILSHGNVVDTDGKAIFKKAFERYLTKG